MVEIGPGAGILTGELVALLKPGRQLRLLEVDDDLIPDLELQYGEKSQLVHTDVLKYSFNEIAEPFGLIGNFPYNISSQILFRALENRDRVPELVGMFQKEVAERIVAKPSTKPYGILSVLIQAYFQVEICIKLKPGAFNPPPKVHSAVIRMERYRASVDGLNERFFFTLVKAAFNQRRKTLRNSIKPYLSNIPPELIPDAILQCRAEELNVEQFIDLSKSIQGYAT